MGGLVAVAATATALLGTGCAESIPTEGPEARAISIYATVVRAVAEDQLPDMPESGPEGTLFITGMDDRTIDLTVQVGLIGTLEDWATVRFIDAVEEAVDLGDPEEPVRGDGLLLGLGTIPDGNGPVLVPVAVHDGPERAVTYEVGVTLRRGDWVLNGPLQPIPVTVPLTGG